MTARIDEIAPDLYRICLYVPAFDLQFNHFLVKDDEPLLFHTGMRGMFPAVREAVATLIDPAQPSLDQLEPLRGRRMRRAQRMAGGSPERHPGVRRTRRDDQHRRLLEPAAARTEAGRDPRRLDGTDSASCRRRTLPHGWDAGVLFEETDRVLLCSDLMHQLGDVEPVTTGDVVGRYRQAFETYQQSPVLMDYVPYTENTKRQLANLAALQPRMLAAMHGSTFVGDGAAALIASGEVIRQVTGVSATV